MNTEETFVWVRDLIPGEPTIERRRVGPSFPEFAIAQTLLGSPVASTASTAADSDAETVAMTTDAGRIEPGLETEDGSDLRVELVTVVTGHTGLAADLLAHAATMIAENPQVNVPTPGTLLPNVAQGLDSSVTARNGLLVVPFLWSEGVPHVHEVQATGKRHAGASGEREHNPKPVEFTHPGRLTMAAQLVMLTDEEMAMVQQQGIEATQNYLVSNGINLNDVRR